MSSQVKAIILLKRVGLSLITATGVQTLTFPEDVLRYEELSDEKQFTELATNFLKNNGGIGVRTLVILSEELVFQKDIPRTENNNAEDQYKAFIAEIPFEGTKLGQLKMYGKDRLKVVAAYAETYIRLKEIIEKGHGKVVAVIPALALSTDFDGAGLEFSRVLKDYEKEGTQMPNFLGGKEAIDTWAKVKPEATVKTVTQTTTHTALLTFILLFLSLVALALGLLKFRILPQKPPAIELPTVSITVTPVAPTSATSGATPTVYPTPSISVTKAELRVRILNGSGISGQAGILKKKFEDIGFINIETGNSITADGKTTAEFGPRVDRAIIKEVIAGLINSLGGDVSEASRSGEIDILITTR